LLQNSLTQRRGDAETQRKKREYNHGGHGGHGGRVEKKGKRRLKKE
jgi:hypothetical protein